MHHRLQLGHQHRVPRPGAIDPATHAFRHGSPGLGLIQPPHLESGGHEERILVGRVEVARGQAAPRKRRRQKGVSGVNRPLVAAVRPREHVTRLRAPLAHEPARPQHLRFPLAELDDRLLPVAGELAVRDVPGGPGVRSEWGDLLGARRRPHAVPLEGHHLHKREIFGAGRDRSGPESGEHNHGR